MTYLCSPTQAYRLKVCPRLLNPNILWAQQTSKKEVCQEKSISRIYCTSYRKEENAKNQYIESGQWLIISVRQEIVMNSNVISDNRPEDEQLSVWVWTQKENKQINPSGNRIFLELV